jgi:pimeloyl-ACP methyl ester carboxylesterase
MDIFSDGRHGKPGFTALGYDCVHFPQGDEPLRERIERFRAFIDDLKAREPQAFPIVTFGYSAGGVIARGFLRAYPERAADIAACMQVGTPNAGLITAELAGVMRSLGMPDPVIADLDVASDFMRWLNGTGGHWEPIEGSERKRWVLDNPPVVAPPGVRILHIVGAVPRYGHTSDGVVDVPSATLDGAITDVRIPADAANHLNLGGLFNLAAFLFRGFRADDEMWQRSVQITHAFLQGHATA